MNVNRRNVLRLSSASIIFTQGCLSSITNNRSNRIGERVSIKNGRMKLTNPRLREAILTGKSPFPAIYSPNSGQYLVVGVTVDGLSDREISLALEINGEMKTNFVSLDNPSNRDLLQNQNQEIRHTAIRFNPISAREGAIITRVGDEDVNWTLPDSVVSSLQKVPSFELVDASIVATNDGTAVEITVSNDGGRDGIFLTTVARAGIADSAELVVMQVDKGTTTTARTVITSRNPNSVEINSTNVRRIVWS